MSPRRSLLPLALAAVAAGAIAQPAAAAAARPAKAPVTAKDLRTVRAQIRALQRDLRALSRRVVVSAPAGAVQTRTLTAAAPTTPDLSAYARLDAGNNWLVAQAFPGVRLTPSGATSASVTTGGALNVRMDNATGAGIIVSSDRGADATGRLLNVRAGSPDFPAAAGHIDYAGTGNAFEISSTSQDDTSQALAVSSTNVNDTALGVTGRERGRGTAKITHIGSGDDGNAAVLSLNLSGAGTAAQGVFLDAPTGTTGKLLNLRNAGVQQLTLSADGVLYARGALGSGAVTPATQITGALTGRLPIVDAAGRTVGWVPLYAGIG